MTPQLIASAALIGLAVSLIAFWFVNRETAPDLLTSEPAPVSSGPGVSLGPVTAQESLLNQPSNLHAVLLQRSRSERVVKPWLNKISGIVQGATPQGRVQELHARAITAGMGRTLTPERIAGLRTFTLIVGLLAGLLLWRTLAMAERGTTGILVGIIVTLVGWRIVDVYLTNRARLRQETITQELPDIADQVAISAQAGLSFEQAIRRTVDSTTGALSDELDRFLQDTRVGVSRQDAFRALAERVDVNDMTTFVRAIAQAEKAGVSIAEILQIQADELRERRKQRAEERAMKLPVLMLFPLVTCILPPLLIVLLGPAILKVIDSGGFS